MGWSGWVAFGSNGGRAGRGCRAGVQDASGGAQAVLLRFEGEPARQVPEDLGEDVGVSVDDNRPRCGHSLVRGPVQLLRQWRGRAVEQGAAAGHQGMQTNRSLAACGLVLCDLSRALAEPQPVGMRGGPGLRAWPRRWVWNLFW